MSETGCHLLSGGVIVVRIDMEAGTPDGRLTAPPEDEEKVRQHARFVAMLEEGLASVRAGRFVTPEEFDAMLEEAFARQVAEHAGKRE